MRTILLLALALAGCATDTETASRTCAWAPDVPTWDNCIAGYIAGVKARRAREVREESEGEAGAAALLLGGAAFMNGMNQRPAITCTSIGGITTCQ